MSAKFPSPSDTTVYQVSTYGFVFSVLIISEYINISVGHIVELIGRLELFQEKEKSLRKAKLHKGATPRPKK